MNSVEGKIKKAVEFLLAASWNFLKFQNKNEEKKNEVKDGKVNESMTKIDEDVSEEFVMRFIAYFKIFLESTFITNLGFIKPSRNCTMLKTMLLKLLMN